MADGSVVAPDAVVLTYQQSLLDELQARGVQPTGGYPAPWRSLWFAGGGGRNIAVAGGFGIGAPGAVIVLEELIALGAREFISIGTPARPSIRSPSRRSWAFPPREKQRARLIAVPGR